MGALTANMAAFNQMLGTYLRVVRPGGDEVRNFVADHATKDKKVVLLMDEAQVFGEDQQPGLGLLHTTGLGFPTVAMLAGLSHTAGMGLDQDPKFRSDAEEFAIALLERGVVAITHGGSYDVAIPSMLDHLNEVARPVIRTT